MSWIKWEEMGMQQPIRTVQPSMLRLCFGLSWIPWTQREWGRLDWVPGWELDAAVRHTWFYSEAWNHFTDTWKHSVVFLTFLVFTVCRILCLTCLHTLSNFLHKLQACLSVSCHVLSHWKWASARPLLHRLLWRLCWKKRTKVIPTLSCLAFVLGLYPMSHCLLIMHFCVTKNQHHLNRGLIFFFVW